MEIDQMALPSVPKSKETRISMHPELLKTFDAIGGANWVRQMLIRETLERMDQARRLIVQTSMFYGQSFGDAVLAYDNVPDAVILKNGRCVSKDYAVANGLKYLSYEDMPTLPDGIELAGSMAPGSTGRPRSKVDSSPVMPPPGVIEWQKRQQAAAVIVETQEERNARIDALLAARRTARLAGVPESELPGSSKTAHERAIAAAKSSGDHQ